MQPFTCDFSLTYMMVRILLVGMIGFTLIGCKKKCKEYMIVEKDNRGRSKIVRVKSGEGCKERKAVKEEDSQ